MVRALCEASVLTNPVVIWRVTDGKRGHERQTEGLVQALAQLMPVVASEIPALPGGRAFWQWLTGGFARGDRRLPALIIGAGHATHWTMLAARRACGGKTVVLMNPGLPRRCFDLCLIPEHDGVREGRNVLPTKGAINAIQPSHELQADAGLILLGGASPHYRWDDRDVVEQVRMLASVRGDVKWRLTTSPRTPGATLELLREALPGNVEMVPFREAPLDWLPGQFRHAGQVWVTPDSVSMLYEALTAGAAVGILDMERIGNGRVARGVGQLLREGKVLDFSRWKAGQPLPVPREEFNEAARCARWIRQTWFPGR
jgi:mitochondrial fission protein ELM1